MSKSPLTIFSKFVLLVVFLILVMFNLLWNSRNDQINIPSPSVSNYKDDGTLVIPFRANISMGPTKSLDKTKKEAVVHKQDKHVNMTPVPESTKRVGNVTQKENCSSIRNVSYILPHYHSTGPSTSYKKVRWAVALAIYHNTGIMAVPFKDHRTQVTPGQSPDKKFEDTFDLERLRQCIPVILPSEANVLCEDRLMPGVIEMIEDPNGKPYVKFDVLRSYPSLRYLDVGNQPRNRFPRIPITKERIPMKEVDFKTISASYQCIAVIPYEMDMEDKTRVNKLVDRYLVRAKYIRDIAQLIVNKICDGHFAVMHWRNKTGETCGLYSSNRAQKEKMFNVVQDAIPIIVAGVVNITKSNSIKCLYIAKPNYEQSIVKHFKATPLKVYTLEDLFKLIPDFRKYTNDYYVLSLIEQEMAERVPLFISSRTSNWSFYVEYTRYIRAKETFGVNQIQGLSKYVVSSNQQIIK